MYKWVPENLILRGTFRLTSIPSTGGGGEIFVADPCYGSQDKRWPNESHGSYADFIYYFLSRNHNSKNYNPALWNYVAEPEGIVLEWIRSVVANRLARTTNEWAFYFPKHNSGT